MGADLFSQDNQTPQFLVWAQRDKLGAPLQRVQIIKGWVESSSGTPKEKVYDVACSDGLAVDPITNRCPDNGAKKKKNNKKKKESRYRKKNKNPAYEFSVYYDDYVLTFFC